MVKQLKELSMKLTKTTLAKSISMTLLCSGLITTTNLLADEEDQQAKETDDSVIVVTAQRREQNFQDVASSLSAYTGEMMADLGIDDLQDFVGKAPGITVTGASSAENTITLRGISPLGGTAAPVAVYLDEMPISGINGNGQPAIKGFDVNRVEILRGPQGTLYGEGSLGGTIKIIMNKPDATSFAGQIDGSFSSTADGDTSNTANLMLNVTLIENELALRGVFQYRDTGGFIDAPNLSKEDVNGEQLTGSRISLQWFATEAFTINISAISQEIELDGRNRGFDETTTVTNPFDTNPGVYNSRETAIGIDQTGDVSYDQYNLTFTYDTDNYQFVSSSSYFTRETDIIRDLAGINVIMQSVGGDMGGGYNMFYTQPIAQMITGINSGVLNERTSETEIFTQEFRISYEMSDDLFWTAGVFYKDRSGMIEDLGGSNPDVSDLVRPEVSLAPIPQLTYSQNPGALLAIADDTFTQTAVFGEITYNLTDNLVGTIGGRYFKEDRESTATSAGYFIQAQVFSGVMGATGDPFAAVGAVQALGLPSVFTESISNNESTWKVNLSYDFDDSDNLIYGTIAKGFRSGGVNSFAVANSGLTGMPINLIPQSFSPDSVINYEIGSKSSWNDGDIIINAAMFYMDWEDVQVLWDPADLGFTMSVNGEHASSQGIEMEGYIKVSDALNVDFAFAYTDAKLDDDVLMPDGSTLFQKGGQLGRIPKHTFNIGADYSFDDIGYGLSGILSACYSYTDELFRDPAENESEKSHAFGLIDLSFSILSDSGWKSRFFVNNLADEDTAILIIAGSQSMLNRPRTIGVNVTYDF